MGGVGWHHGASIGAERRTCAAAGVPTARERDERLRPATGIPAAVLVSTLIGASFAEPLAFPGAEGEGAYASGGRGGTVYVVTSVADDGPGTLREAVAAEGTRTIVFGIAGEISLESPLRVYNGNLTIAGQSAPPGGITVRGEEFSVTGDNVILRHLRFRRGNEDSAEGGEADSVTMYDATNVIVDHVSASWSTDEVLSVTNNSDMVTVQWSLLTEGLTPHSNGSIIGAQDGAISFHHNFYSSSSSRLPRPTGYSGHPGADVDFRNNVVYNWEHWCGYTGTSEEFVWVNLISNYYRPGPTTWGYYDGYYADIVFIPQSTSTSLWIEGNVLDGFFDADDDQTLMVLPEYGWRALDAPVETAEVITDDATTARDRVLREVGAAYVVRDGVDSRVLHEFASGGGRLKETADDAGGWPTLLVGSAPADTDTDGMPDWWEQRWGLAPDNDTDSGSDLDGDGWTNLEEYLNQTPVSASSDAPTTLYLETFSNDSGADLDPADLGWTVVHADGATGGRVVSATGLPQDVVNVTSGVAGEGSADGYLQWETVLGAGSLVGSLAEEGVDRTLGYTEEAAVNLRAWDPTEVRFALSTTLGAVEAWPAVRIGDDWFVADVPHALESYDAGVNDGDFVEDALLIHHRFFSDANRWRRLQSDLTVHAETLATEEGVLALPDGNITAVGVLSLLAAGSWPQRVGVDSVEILAHAVDLGGDDTAVADTGPGGTVESGRAPRGAEGCGCTGRGALGAPAALCLAALGARRRRASSRRERVATTVPGASAPV